MDVTGTSTELKEALKAYHQGSASLEATRSLAADLGNHHFEDGIVTLLALLDHRDDIVRYNAANSLSFEFRYKQAGERLMSMLAGDTDEDCRRAAAAGLGNVWENSRKRDVLEALADAAINDKDEYVRRSAYKSLQIVNGVSRQEHLDLLRNENLSVDPVRVSAIISKR